MRRLSEQSAAHGFTLIELIIVIVIMAIVASLSARFLTRPVEQFMDVAGRAELVDVADTALRQLGQEIRQALPNSIRIDSGNKIEFLRTLDGGRYRARPPGDPLRFFPPGDNGFDVVGQINNLSQIQTGSASDCRNSNAECLVVYNTGQPGADAYAGDNIATVTSVSDNTAGDGSDQIQFDTTTLAGNRFPYASPSQRFYIVDTPVTIICDTATGEIRRYQDYTISAGQPTDPGIAPLNTAVSALLVNQVSSCQFDYSPGSLSRSGLLTIRLTLIDTRGESIKLMKQINVYNTP